MRSDIKIIPYDDSMHRQQVIDLWNGCFDYSPVYKDPAFAIDTKLAVDNLFYVALADDAVVGCIMVGYDGHRGWLYSLAVDPVCRKGGVGSALVVHALDVLRGLGCPKVNVQIHESNKDVLHFYEANGFTDDAVISMGRRLV